MNFSATSYRTEVNASYVLVRVMVFGSFASPFIVEVIPNTVDTPKGNDSVTAFWDSINFSGDRLFFDNVPREVLFPLHVQTAFVPIHLYPEEVGDMDLQFNVTLIVPRAAMSQGVVLSEPSQATVTVLTNRGKYVFIICSNYVAILYMNTYISST